MNDDRHAPAAPSSDDERTPSGTVPPWSVQHSRARAIHASTGWSADSKPTSRSDDPSVTPALLDSPASRRRQFEGKRPACDTARAASTPSVKLAKRTLADALNFGRSCTRIH